MKLIWLLVVLLISFDATAACRSTSVKRQFDKEQGYPKGRPGYIVDHICALGQGGLDITTNMQYQTKAESLAKDKIENTAYGKALFCNKDNSLSYRTVFNCN